MTEIISELMDGLILRAATIEDAEKIVDFNAAIHGRENELERRTVGSWTRDLMSGQHPTFKISDFILVEDPVQQKIISSLNLISQIWSYDGVPFKVGRIELVGTLPEYRRRGLVRAQLDEVHRWSQERGELVQVITGIPYYYRQFGYEMALSLGGGQVGFLSDVPILAKGEQEPYLVRPAQETDLAFIAELYDRQCRRSLISCQWNLDLWRYEMMGKSADNVCRKELMVITDVNGSRVGFLAHSFTLWTPGIGLEAYYLTPEVSWWEVTPSVMRYLGAKGQEYASQIGKPCPGFYFALGEEHPSYQVFAHRLPKQSPPYAFYIRVPDLPAFLRTISSVLEKRLAENIRPGYSGELQIGFYRSGLLLKFTDGLLAQVEILTSAADLDSVTAGFPGLTFFQLVFGYRTLDELRYAFPDCWVNNDKARPLLDALFSKRFSSVWAIS